MVNPTYPLIRNCVLISLGTVGVEVTGNMVLIDNQIEASTNIYVNSGGRAYVSSVEGITYDGPGDVEPLPGDRSVWDALNYQSRHANDINAATGIHHTRAALDTLYQPIDDTLTTLAALADAAGVLTNDGAGVLSWEADTDTTIANDPIWDVKGDVVAATGANAAARVPIGTDGQVLTADSTQTAGVKWTNITAFAPVNVYNETISADGSSLTYYLANYAAPSTIRVYIDGIRQPATDDAAPTDVVTFSVAPDLGAVLLFDYEMDIT